MGTASLTLGSISVTIILKTVSESKTVTPEKKITKHAVKGSGLDEFTVSCC
jgi:hypothetical protein